MKFATTIRIVTEAKDKNEAMEIAGEYLSGNLATGVDMECRTNPVSGSKEKISVALAVLLIVGLLTVPLSYIRHSQSSVQVLPGNCVIQPPLKTLPTDKKYPDFRKEWQARHAQEVLNSLKK